MFGVDKIPNGYLKYYITSTGKIWGIQNEECLDGDAQKRREMLGNSFNTPEEAALAKVKQEATTRLAPYARKELRIEDGDLTIVTKYHLGPKERELLEGDVILLANT